MQHCVSLESLTRHTTGILKHESQQGKNPHNQRTPLGEKKNFYRPPPASTTETTQLSWLIAVAVRQRGPAALLPLSPESQRARPSRSVLPSCHAHWSWTNRPLFPGSFPHWGRHSFPRHAIHEVNKESSCSSQMSSRHIFPSFMRFLDFFFFLKNSTFLRPYFKRTFIFSMFFNKSLFLRELPEYHHLFSYAPSQHLSCLPCL